MILIGSGCASSWSLLAFYFEITVDVPNHVIYKLHHYANMPMHYAEIFEGCKNDNF